MWDLATGAVRRYLQEGRKSHQRRRKETAAAAGVGSPGERVRSGWRKEGRSTRAV